MKIAFISFHVIRSERAVPLAAAMLASSLKEKFDSQVKVKLIDAWPDTGIDSLLDEIISFAPDIAAFPLYVWNNSIAEETALQLKQTNPEIITLTGGPEASVNADLLIQKKAWDFLLKGEGEESICELMRLWLDAEQNQTAAGDINLPETLIRTRYIDDCTRLPSPYLDGTLPPEERSGLLWELSRGCPFKCAFCFESRGKSGIRPFSEERILTELQSFNQGPPKEIFVLDPTFNYQEERAVRLLDMIIENGDRHHYSFEIRFEYLTETMAERFSLLHCSLQIGIQSLHPEVLKKINRSIRRELLDEKCELLNAYGICFGFDLIYGLPGDTLSGFIQSLEECVRLQPNHIDLFPLSVLPGTRLGDDADELRLNHLKTPPYTVISSESFPQLEMNHASELASLFNLFYNRGKAVPWFYLLQENLDLSVLDILEEIKNSGINIPSDDCPWKEILAFQLQFADFLFSRRKLSESGTVMCELIRFMGIESSLQDGDWDPEDSVHSFRRNPLEIITYIESGVDDLGEIAFFVREKEISLDFYQL